MLVMVAAFTALSAGCGGGGSADAGGQTYSVEAGITVTTADLPKARFIPRVNKICRHAWVAILENWDVYSRTQDPQLSEKARFVEALRLSLMAGIDFHIFDEIYNLGAPRGEGHRVEEIIGQMQSAVERGQKNLAPIASVAQVSELFHDYNQRAHQYGLDDCLVDAAHLRDIESSRSTPRG